MGMSELRVPTPPSPDVRCHCGKLIARWQGVNLVIKCARCARFITIHHSAIRGTPPPDPGLGRRE